MACSSSARPHPPIHSRTAGPAFHLLAYYPNSAPTAGRLQHTTRVVCTSGGHSYHSFSGPHKKLKQEQEQLLIKVFASLNTADRESAAPAAPQDAPGEGPDGDKGNADSIEKVEDKDSDVVLFPDGFLDDVSIKSLDWVSIVPNHMLPHGDRLIFNHSGEEVMLCWFQGQIYALSNTSPASGKRFSDAEITEDGIIVCPHTQSRFDMKTGEIVDWLPNESLLARIWSPPISDLSVYAVKVSPDHIYINTQPAMVGGYFALAEFAGNRISTDPNYEKPIIWESLEEDLKFGFTAESEIANGRAAMLGFLSLIMLEMTTGEGLLKVTGMLDWLYQYLPGTFPLIRY